MDDRTPVRMALGARWSAAVLAVAAAAALAGCHRGDDLSAESSRAGLVVQTGQVGAAKLRPDRLLGCYAAGRLIGQRTVADCARRNGMPAGDLDVGLAAVPAATDAAAPTLADAGAGGLADCAQFVDGSWARVAQAISLPACVKTLFDGQCLAQGVVARGRWADRLLRLADGRVESTGSDQPYRVVAVQADGCAISLPPAAEG